MASLNQVVLAGNVTKDIELRYSTKGTAVANLTLAISEKRKVGEEWKEETAFVDVNVWGSLAERCSQFLSKGKGAVVTGKLMTEKWEKDGKNYSKLSVLANNVQFLWGREGETSAPQRSKPPEQKPEPTVTRQNQDDIPF